MARHFSEFDEYDVQSDYRPIGAWGYIGYNILFGLPIVGLILIVVFSFSNTNINRRNYARSYLIGVVFLLILTIVLAVTGRLGEIMSSIPNNGQAFVLPSM
ncbi:MAG: hypothetical protein IKG21_13350 [Atopobiaceae bacterium]|nr:hypothetical protein [Atopobiaceae bacterium]